MASLHLRAEEIACITNTGYTYPNHSGHLFVCMTNSVHNPGYTYTVLGFNLAILHPLHLSEALLYLPICGYSSPHTKKDASLSVSILTSNESIEALTWGRLKNASKIKTLSLTLNTQYIAFDLSELIQYKVANEQLYIFFILSTESHNVTIEIENTPLYQEPVLSVEYENVIRPIQKGAMECAYLALNDGTSLSLGPGDPVPFSTFTHTKKHTFSYTRNQGILSVHRPGWFYFSWILPVHGAISKQIYFGIKELDTGMLHPFSCSASLPCQCHGTCFFPIQKVTASLQLINCSEFCLLLSPADSNLSLTVLAL